MATTTKGQLPPYPSASRLSDSPCAPQYAASLRCLEEFSKDKNKCQEHFDTYKECMKKEDHFGLTLDCRKKKIFKEARLERNRGRSLFS